MHWRLNLHIITNIFSINPTCHFFIFKLIYSNLFCNLERISTPSLIKHENNVHYIHVLIILFDFFMNCEQNGTIWNKVFLENQHSFIILKIPVKWLDAIIVISKFQTYQAVNFTICQYWFSWSPCCFYTPVNLSLNGSNIFLSVNLKRFCTQLLLTVAFKDICYIKIPHNMAQRRAFSAVD